MTSYKYFPEGRIFVNIVDPGVGSDRHIILIQTKEYYFLAPDNGILSCFENSQILNYMLLFVLGEL